MSDGQDGGNAPRPGQRSPEQFELITPPKSIAEFEFQQNQQELARNAKRVEALNKKAENTIRLIGVLFGIIASASLLVARLTIEESSFSLEFVINEYIALSIACLAVAFILALLAYQKTDLHLYPSSSFFEKQQTADNDIEEVYEQLNNRIPKWIEDNSGQIEGDNTLLFNCQMLIFFSLIYLVFGGLKIAYSISPWLTLLVILISLVLYWRVREYVAEDPTDSSGG
jgi:hypothetical protein